MKTEKTILKMSMGAVSSAFCVLLFCLFCSASLGVSAQTPRLEITGENFSMLSLLKNGLPFTNRPAMKFNVNPPAEYAGCEYTQINANSSYMPGPLPVLKVKAATAGYVVAMVATGALPDLCAEWAEDNDWELIPDLKIPYGGGGANETFTFYRKWIEANVVVEIVQPATFSGAVVLNPLPAITEEIVPVPTQVVTTAFMETQNFVKGAVAYANRVFIYDMPSASAAVLQNLQITRYNGESVRKTIHLTAEETGNMYVAISNYETDFVPTDHGWSKIEGVIFVYSDGDQTKFTVYKKAVTKGDRVSITTASWQGVHVLSSQLTGYSLPVLLAEAKPFVDNITESTEESERLTLAYNTANALLGSETDVVIINACVELRAAVDAYKGLQQATVLFEDLLEKARVEEAKNYPGVTAFSAKLAEVSDSYDAATGKTEIEQLFATLYSAMSAYVYTQPATSSVPLDLTCLISYPSFHKGTTHDNAMGISIGWSTDNVTINAGDIQVRFKGGRNCWNSWSKDFTSMDLYQDVKGLKPGYYKVSCYAMTEAGRITDQRAYARSSEGTVYSDVMTVDDAFDTPEGWEKLETETVAVYADGTLRIGFNSTSPGGSASGWFCATDFALEYLGDYELTEADNAVSVTGLIVEGQEERINALLTETVTSLDLSGAQLHGDLTITAGNPNTLIYGVNANVEVTSGIAEGSTASLDDSKPFHAPGVLAANVSYTREFNKENSICNTSNGNWQTICLPFDVTGVTAMQGGAEVNLIPISQFQNDESANAARPYWLYEIGADNVLVPAAAILANVPYLIAVPNDEATYKPFYNISGDVVFTGASLSITTVETGSTSTYILTNNFAPIAANTSDYGINPEGTYFVPNVAILSFSAKVAPVGDGAQPAFISIFEDDVTALPALPAAALQAGIEVFVTSTGVMIQAVAQSPVSIFSVSGQLVKAVQAEEGMNYVSLSPGQYVINGSVVIVK